MTKCRNCSVELKNEPINPESKYQFENALWVGFFGGYGMFVDDIDVSWSGAPRTLPGAAEEAVICHDCAHELCETIPWIKELLRPDFSHSHREGFWQENPDHQSWERDAALERLRERLKKAKEDYPNG